MTTDQLTREERIDLAVCCYGLYSIGLASNECQRIDEDCAMDNMGVPFLRSQLTDHHLKVLAGINRPLTFTLNHVEWPLTPR